jgi:ribosome recycling factor
MEDQRGNFADETSDMASENAMNASSDLRKRRSTRIVQAVPLAVTGVDALGRPFTERTSTLIINCHGCRYQSKHYVLKNMWVTLEIPHPESGQQARNVRGRVAWIQRPRTVRQLFQVALELEQPGNAWGMAFPPEDWFTFPEASAAHAAATITSGETLSGMPHVASSGTESGHGEHLAGAGSESGAEVKLSEAEAPPVMAGDNVRIFPSPVSTTDASLQLARQMTRLLNDAKQQIQAAARDAATQAVSAERHRAFEEWEQKFAAARVEVVNEAERALGKIQREAEAQAKRVAATAEELAEKTRNELPLSVTPQLHELAQSVAQEFSGKLVEQGAAHRAQFEQHAAGTAETLRALCEQAEAAISRLTAHRESAEAQLQERAEAAKKILDETVQETLRATLHATNEALEERTRTLEAAGQVLAENLQRLEHQSRALEESRHAEEESGRRRAAALTGQGEALQGAVRESANRLAELFEAQAKAQETARMLSEETARTADAGAARVAALQDQVLERHAVVQATFEASWRAQLESEMEAAKERWREHVAATIQGAIAEAVRDAVATATAEAGRGLDEHARGLTQEMTGQLHEEAAQSVERLLAERVHGQLDGQVAALHEAANRVSGETEQHIAGLRDVASQVAAQAAGETKHRLTELREAAAAAVREAEQRVAGVRSSAEEFASTALREKTERLDPLVWRAGEAIARLEQFSARLDSAQEDSLHGFRAQLDDVLSLHRNELHRRSESLFEEINGRIRKAFEDTSRQAVEEFAQQVSATVQPHVTQAEEAVHRLAGGRSLLDAAMTLQQDRIRGFADEAFANSLARFRENLGSVEQVLQDASQAITERSLAEMEGKVESLRHQAIEDVFKSSEWYEKKAQTHIQSATERAVEQAANLLREKAGEVSGTFASEVDHASRNFISHTQTQMEEVLRDAFERSRALFAEAAETTEAAFTDEIQRTARRELAGFGEEVQRSAGEMHGQLETARVELALRTSAEQEDFLRRFQAGMSRAMESSVAEARNSVEASFAPLLETFRNVTHAHQEELRGAYQKAGEEAAEEHREKLRGISNQWMLATVASLDQQSRAMVANIAATAEQQLRTACEQVFAGVGDSLRERMREIASGMDAKAKGQSA